MGWAKHQLKNRYTIGDKIKYKKDYWQINAESRDLKRLERVKTKNEQYLKDNPRMNELMGYPVYTIQKIQRSKNYKKYDWYRLLRRKRSQEELTDELHKKFNACDDWDKISDQERDEKTWRARK